MSEYASAQKGSASGSLQDEASHRQSGKVSASAAPAMAVPYCPGNILMDMPVVLQYQSVAGWANDCLMLVWVASRGLLGHLPTAPVQACMPLT